MSKKMKPISGRDYKEIKRYSMRAFKNIGSESYRQRLVYKLLNTARTNNQTEFFSFLLRTLNSRKGDENIKMLCNKLGWIYPLNQENFEKVAYSIILGIMAANKGD